MILTPFILMSVNIYAELLTFECTFSEPTEYDAQGKKSYRIYREPKEDTFIYDTKKKQIT